METRNINNREYSELEITSIQINGEERENKFDINDINASNRISLNINISVSNSDDTTSILSSETNLEEINTVSTTNIIKKSNKSTKLYLGIGVALLVLGTILYLVLK